MHPLHLSLVMIVKNEEEFLARALESALPLVEELILVDTGSSDRSVEVAEPYAQKVQRFVLKKMEWKDDFALARNEAASYATCPWILFLDGDEILDPSSGAALAKALQDPDIDCYSLVQRNYSFDSQLQEAVHAKNPPPLLEVTSPLYYFENDMDRLYRREVGLLWEGSIHESLLPSCQRLGRQAGRLPIVLHHYGRLKKNFDPQKKALYYLGLTTRKWQENPHNPAAWMELMVAKLELQDTESAFAMAERAIELFPQEPEVIKTCFQAALQNQIFDRAEEWIRLYLQAKPQNSYALSQLTTALLYQKKFEAMEALALSNLSSHPHDTISHINLAVIYFEFKKWPEARKHLEAALRERPGDSFLLDALRRSAQHVS